MGFFLPAFQQPALHHHHPPVLVCPQFGVGWGALCEHLLQCSTLLYQMRQGNMGGCKCIFACPNHSHHVSPQRVCSTPATFCKRTRTGSGPPRQWASMRATRPVPRPPATATPRAPTGPRPLHLGGREMRGGGSCPLHWFPSPPCFLGRQMPAGNNFGYWLVGDVTGYSDYFTMCTYMKIRVPLYSPNP